MATVPSIKPELGYIDQYKYIAISEMKRTGIPASIKLAQGLMESMSGRSELAINANNHFGIKCKNSWEGETYQYKDDDVDEKGEIIHSCFRKYTAAEESYIDHSEFLTGRKRYKLLFDFDKTDYLSWARGLQNCGYATDPLYAEKLIVAIEKYQLYLFDQLDASELTGRNMITENKIELPERPREVQLVKQNTTKGSFSEKSRKQHSRKKSRKLRKISTS